MKIEKAVIHIDIYALRWLPKYPPTSWKFWVKQGLEDPHWPWHLHLLETIPMLLFTLLPSWYENLFIWL